MTSSLTRFRRLGTAAFVCASIGAIACSSTDEGSTPGGRGGSKAGGTGGSGGAAGGSGATGGSTGTGATGGTGSGATGGTGGATGGAGGATGGTGGTAGKGGTGGTGGTAGTGGTTGGTAGTGGATGGTAGTGGATGGTAGTAGAAGGTAGTAGKGGTAGTAGTGGTGGVADAGGAKDSGGTTGDASGTRFSFFVTSQAALVALSGNAKGFGGDLRFGEADGLTGADKICTQTAERGMAGNGKTWRAFLSVSKGPGGTQVNAIDRIGDGPWYDRQARLLALNKTDLLQARPKGADPAIANDLPNENGVPNQFPDGSGMMNDNHATLTGSGPQGTLWTSGLAGTCQDWTNATAAGGKPHIGYTFPRGTTSSWISIMDEPGCLAGGTIIQTGGADPNDPSVGSSGGYGGFYCFALTP
jgi:hypothetical protein